MFQSKEGQAVPQVVFRTRHNNDWLPVSSNDIFAGKKVIVFSLPGAFTPTCSSTHLPRYNELAQTFKAEGIDEIVCISVNDGFIMEAWGQDQDAANIRLLPDGNGEFTEGMGMIADMSEVGFGNRSWRYSMLVNDGIVEKMFIEPVKPGDPFEVSDADTMLNYINADAKQPARVTLFSKPGCAHCQRAKSALSDKGMPYEEIVLGAGGVSFSSLAAVTGAGTTPQVFIDGKLIGGADELEAYFA